MRRRPKILLVGLSHYGMDREFRRGINQYANIHGPWSLLDLPQGQWKRFHDFLEGTEGVIANITDPGIEMYLLKAGIPIVNLSGELEHPRTPVVNADSHAIGKLGAEYLMQRGLKNFIFYGMHRWRFERLREQGYCETLHAAGYTAQVFYEMEFWDKELCRIMQEAPKPCGVMASNDQLGRRICGACYDAEIAVPEEISVLAVDDNELICETGYPQLSSIRMPGYQMGMKAAEIMDGLLSGETPEDSLVMFQPIDVHERQSSEIMAINDPVIARALNFIRENSDRKIKVEDVAHHTGQNRRNLERLFRKHLDSTILEQIHETRLKRACELLTGSTLLIPDVAERAGFSDMSSFGQLFKRRFGTSPNAFRKNAGKKA